MEITKIGADAFKVKITAGELAEWGMRYTDIGIRKTETAELLDRVLLQIAETHQKAYLPQETVTEFFPDRNGGCYLYLNALPYTNKVSEARRCCAYFTSEGELDRYFQSVKDGSDNVYQWGNGYVLSDPKHTAALSEFSVPITFDGKGWALFLEYAE